MAQYGSKASEKVEKAMRERKKGTLKSGRSGKKVKSRKQAIAIGLSQPARRAARFRRRNLPQKNERSSGVVAWPYGAPAGRELLTDELTADIRTETSL